MSAVLITLTADALVSLLIAALLLTAARGGR